MANGPISKLIFALVALAAFPALTFAEEGVSALSLAEAEKVMFGRSPVLRQVDALADAAKARVEEAQAGRLPYVSGDASFTRTTNPVYVFGSLMEQERFTADRFQVDKLNNPSPENNMRTAINAQLPIFDGYQTEVRTARALLGVEESGARREQAEQALRFELVRAYFGSLIAEERASVASETIKTVEADAKKISDLAEVGLLVRSDHLAVLVQLSDFRQQAISAEAEAAIARAGLNSLLGYPEDARPALTTKLAEKSFALPVGGEAAASALKNRPELALDELAVKAAGEGLRQADNQYLPRADLFGAYGMSDNTLGVESTDWTVGIKVTMPIFDGGRSARVSQAAASEVAAKAGKRVDEDRLKVEALAAHRRCGAAKEKLAVAAGAVAQAFEAHRIVLDRFQVGLTTVTEVLRAENALLGARLGELMARYHVYVGYAEFLRASGNLRNLDAF